MDLKKSLTIVIGVVVVAIVVLAIAAVAFSFINGNLSGEPTPGPEASPTQPGASPGATAKATPTAIPGTPTSSPIYLSAVLNQTSGMCLVTIMLNKDATPVDVTKLTMNMVCNGQTYSNVWTPNANDWAGSNGNTLLEFGEVLAPQIDTASLGIPQGLPVVVKILQGSTELQQATATMM